MVAGLALALGSALGTNVAFLFKQRGAVLAPPVRARHPLSSAVGLFRSRWFSLGWAVAVVAWGLHVGALALAPLSIVQAVARVHGGWSTAGNREGGGASVALHLPREFPR